MTKAPEAMLRRIERFWAHGRREGECLIWPGSLTSTGYGIVQFRMQRRTVHRLAYELATGEPVPEGLYVCHSCDRKACYEPTHLWAGTHLENMADMISKDRSLRNEAQPNAKLTAVQIREIRAELPRLLAVKRKHHGLRRQLAQKYGISESYINSILRGAERHYA